MELRPYLCEHPYIDFSAPNIRQCGAELFFGVEDPVKKAKIAYYFVRDEIPHSFDCTANVITARASDVLRHRTGICHAKANLFAALLRPQGVPVGFCFQRITLAEDDSMGYGLHAFNAVYLDGAWRKLDVRGNKEGICAAFTLESSAIAYPRCRTWYEEWFYAGVFDRPHMAVMKMLEESKTLRDVLDHIPDSMEGFEG